MEYNKPCYVIATNADNAKYKALSEGETWQEDIADSPQGLTDRLRQTRMFCDAKIWRVQVIASEVI